MRAFLSELEKEKIEYKKDVQLSCISSFKVGGTSDAVVYPHTVQSIR